LPLLRVEFLIVSAVLLLTVIAMLAPPGDVASLPLTNTPSSRVGALMPAAVIAGLPSGGASMTDRYLRSGALPNTQRP
jgi:hypothetical protein